MVNLWDDPEAYRQSQLSLAKLNLELVKEKEADPNYPLDCSHHIRNFEFLVTFFIIFSFMDIFFCSSRSSLLSMSEYTGFS